VIGVHDLDSFVRQILTPQGYLNPVVVSLTQMTSITHTFSYSGQQRTVSTSPHEATWRIEVSNNDEMHQKRFMLLASVDATQNGALTLISQQELL
jgi:hypothetical protein